MSILSTYLLIWFQNVYRSTLFQCCLNTIHFSVIMNQILLTGRIINLTFFGEIENQVALHRINGCAWKNFQVYHSVISKLSNGQAQLLMVILAWVYAMIPQLESRASTKVKPVHSFGPAPSGTFNLNKWQLSVTCTRFKAHAAAIAGLLYQFLGLKSFSRAELRFWGLVHAQPLDWRRGSCLSKRGFLEPFLAECWAKSYRKSNTSHSLLQRPQQEQQFPAGTLWPLLRGMGTNMTVQQA